MNMHAIRDAMRAKLRDDQTTDIEMIAMGEALLLELAWVWQDKKQAVEQAEGWIATLIRVDDLDKLPTSIGEGPA